MSNKSRRCSGDPRKRAEVRLQEWMRDHYDRNCEDDPFWHGAAYFEVPRLSMDQGVLMMQLEILAMGVREIFGKAPEGTSRRYAAIIDHPFDRNLSILRHKLDVALPEERDSAAWTERTLNLSSAPAGTVRREYDEHRARVVAMNHERQGE